MNLRLMLLGSAVYFAPEDDRGSSQDDPPEQDDDVGGDDEDQDEDDFDPDDQDDDADDDSGGADDPPDNRQRQQPRGQNRFQRLNDRAKDAEAERDRLRAELDAARRGPPASQQSQEELQAERQRRLNAMTAEQRVEFLQRESEQRLTNRLNQIEFATWDGNDQAAFTRLCAKEPAVAKIANRVEKRLTELRAQGQNASRETVAKYVLGEMALERQGRANREGRQREQEGRDRQVSRPQNGRGDLPRDGQRRGSESQQRRKRLEGQFI